MFSMRNMGGCFFYRYTKQVAKVAGGQRHYRRVGVTTVFLES